MVARGQHGAVDPLPSAQEARAGSRAGAGGLAGVSGHGHARQLCRYWVYSCGYALCNAPHLRELAAVTEQGGQTWAAQMKDLLVGSKEVVSAARAGGQTAPASEVQANFAARYRGLIKEGLALNPARPPPARAAPGPGEAEQSVQLAGAPARPRGGSVAVHGGLAGAVRQQPGGAEPAHGQGAAENIGLFSQFGGDAGLLPDSRLPLHVAQTRQPSIHRT